MHEHWFGKRKSFPNKTPNTLSERTISALDMCSFSCFLAYLCELIFWNDKLICPARKSVKHCPLQYSFGTFFHNSWHIFSLRSPTARATIWRVFLQRAIQIHTLFPLLSIKDHSSSISIMVDFVSFALGETSVSLKGGSSPAFFLANLRRYCVTLQMFLSALASCFAPGMIW